MPEPEATDRLLAKYGPVAAIRLLGYAYKLEVNGEEWLRGHVSRQQLLHIRRQFDDAGVPWGEGVIEWPALLRGAKRLQDDAKARKERAQEQLAAARARRAARTV